MKKCFKCDIIKEENEFYLDKKTKDKLHSWCKECCKNAKRNERIKNKEHLKKYRKERREKNKEKILEQEKRRRERRKEKQRIYMREYMKKRRREDLIFRLRHNVSRIINAGLKKQNVKKNNSIWSILPYGPQQLKEHLEKQFDDKMSWENYGTYWNIDHIIPQSKLLFNNVKHSSFQKCWALENLRPLEKMENIKKSNKIIGDSNNGFFR